jgi:hypothetical protein
MTTAEQQAAAAVMARTAQRLHATANDLQRVLTTLFADSHDVDPIAFSKVKAGTPLSPADKTTIRQLVTAGWDNHAIATEVGCSVQAITGVRAGMHSTARAKARA